MFFGRAHLAGESYAQFQPTTAAARDFVDTIVRKPAAYPPWVEGGAFFARDDRGCGAKAGSQGVGAEAALPASERGPTESGEFRRFAAIGAWVAIRLFLRSRNRLLAPDA